MCVLERDDLVMVENAEIIFDGVEENEDYILLIKRVINKCFEEENINSKKIYISITLTTSENIRMMNKKYRDIDRSTDVLSFPMFTREEIKNNRKKILEEVEEQNEQDVLGDIVISIPQVYEQAQDFGHSFERELSYMIVHGFYHLMGYDHIEEEDKKEMREKEENILSKLNINR